MKRRYKGTLQKIIPHTRVTTLSLGLCMAVLLCTVHIHGAEPQHQHPLLQNALQQRLYADPYWHVLLHYNKDSTWTGSFGAGNVHSQIDNDEFFISVNGKTDPRAELTASIEAFFIETDTELINRFPARYKWLAEKMDLPPEERDSHFSQEYIDFSGKIARVEKIVLVFASDYIKAPASMFGHTFFRIDLKNSPEMQSITINFAADTGNSGFAEYILKGIGGGFPGMYSTQHYYTRIQEYNYRESRDLWEYELNLNRAEIRRFFDHYLEIERYQADYFFFTENCSYNILYLLDAARPGLQLTNKCRRLVIPLDTVKLANKHGLIERTTTRPSIGRRIRRSAFGMTKEEISYAKKMATRETDTGYVLHSKNFTREEKRRIYDLAIEYYHYKYFPEVNNSADTDMEAVITLSRPRSKLGMGETKEILAYDPRESHDPFLLESGLGYGSGSLFSFLTLRYAYHERTDNLHGFGLGGEIVVPKMTIRHDFTEEYTPYTNPSLEQLTLVKVSSFHLRDFVFKQLSWSFSAGFERDHLETGRLGGYSELTIGGSWELHKNLYFYIMPGIYFNITNPDRYNTALLIQNGMLLSINRKNMISGEISPRKYLFFDSAYAGDAAITYSYSVNRNNAIFLSYTRSYTHVDTTHSGSVSGGIRLYF